MRSFPEKLQKNCDEYSKNYFKELNKVQKKINISKISDAANFLIKSYKNKKYVFICGNGGSASVSNHLVCDHLKGISQDTSIKPRVISLSSNIETITAISNDLSYEEVFVYQLSRLANKGDCLITISSSGNSKNIIKAIDWANKNSIKTISLNGFSGGKAGKTSNISINVPSRNYGIIEDSHQVIMHIIAQYSRMKHLNKNLKIKNINF
tara:strand:- start:1103 stop:1729 length:627 start_codon:yes stop_codon:yes gene_type:complete